MKFAVLFLLASLVTAFAVVVSTPAADALLQHAGELIRNGSFEGGGGADGRGGGVPEWAPYGLGYDIDRRNAHTLDQCIRCDSLNPDVLHGAVQTVTLNQPKAVPVIVTGWSKADSVSGSRDTDYSIYIDAVYTDGSSLYGQAHEFDTGTHGWERRQVMVVPAKPLRQILVYALFRHHTGTAWFDDFSAHQLEGAGIFDGQPLLPLPSRTQPAGRTLSVTGRDGLRLDVTTRGEIAAVRAGSALISPHGASGGFYLRDVAADGPLVPMWGESKTRQDGGLSVDHTAAGLHIVFDAKIVPHGDALLVDGEIEDATRQDRAITVYLALPAWRPNWVWGRDIRQSAPLSGDERANLVSTPCGATGTMSLYPFACVSGADGGMAIANQMDWPSIYRLFYNGVTRQLVIAWDLALTGKTAAWPAHNARFRCLLCRLAPPDAVWGFRAAALRFYALNAPRYTRRAKADGIWIPFTDPSTVHGEQDFGFAYHEGDNSIRSDNALGILSFRYTEPMTFWMPMPPEMPRTYENALNVLAQDAKSEKPDVRDAARAVGTSGTEDPSGKYNFEFRSEPWANGAVWTLDPNPELPATAAQPTKAYINYNAQMADGTYGQAAVRTRGVQDGEYLDSLEAWADVEDYRPSDLAAHAGPLTFDNDSRTPVLPEWFSTFEFARYLSTDLHNRGKLLFANTTPVRFSIFSSVLDVMGIEVNWLDNGRFAPDTDETLNLRRTLSFRKPYLLLQNTDFDRFDAAMVRRYFERCLFYGIFPSMFSYDAADKPYWGNPKWYDRDRPLFRQYIPIIRQLSAAGWEPITHARCSAPTVYVERYGARLLTLLNDSAAAVKSAVEIEARPLGLSQTTAARELISGRTLAARREGERLIVPVSLAAGQAMAILLQ